MSPFDLALAGMIGFFLGALSIMIWPVKPECKHDWDRWYDAPSTHLYNERACKICGFKQQRHK